ncbi:MAG TPA: cation ABC transporter substrate-binding protein, partial [Desulfocapsa sulfexigens]|nr:cation ABC transporter substrate-binding protein [Desulfocapsa sulfexigens]
MYGSVALATDKPTVFVSILPQKYFVQQISMDHITVEVMVQPASSPAT